MKIAENKALAGKRIGILGKGGSGKSTVTVLLAKALLNYGYQVCVLDADSTNTGLPKTLGIEESPAHLLDYFGGSEFSGGSVSCPVDNPSRLAGAELSLNNLPDKYYAQGEEGITLLEAGKIGDEGPGAGCDGPISKITRDFKINGIENCVTLIDVKAGLEGTGRGIITEMDWIITVVDPTTASIQIAEDIKRQVQEMKAGKLPDTEHLENPELVETANKVFREARVKKSLVLLNKIKNEQMENYLRKELEKREIKSIGTIWEDPSISRSWLEGSALEEAETTNGITHVLEKLEELNG